MTSNLVVNRTQVARTITKSLGASRQLDALAAGVIGPADYMPETDGQYNQFRRYLHDVFCLALIDHGHFDHHEFTLSMTGLHTNNQKLNKQKPDLVTISDANIHLGEVTVSYVPEQAFEAKMTRYKDLMDFLKESEFDVTLSVIVVDLSNPEWRESFPPISDLFVNIIDDMMESLRIIHTNPRFNALRKQESGLYELDRFEFLTEGQTLVSMVKSATGVEAPAEYIDDALTHGGSVRMTDDEYMDQISRSIIESKWHERPRPEPRSMNPTVLLEDYKKMCETKPNTTKVPKILQLGMFTHSEELKQSFEQTIKSLRSCSSSGGYLDYIKSSLQRSAVPDNHIITLNITTDQLEKEQSEGPGRKSYLKRNGLVEKRSAPTHIGLSKEHITKLDEFMAMIEDTVQPNSIKEVETQDFTQAGLAASDMLSEISSIFRSSPASTVLSFYQSLSNEIVLNSMRRRKAREYSLGYSGFDGIYFLVAPGPQLRTESNIEFVKIVSLKPPIVSPFSATWHPIGDHWESSWLSVDTDRLKHWQRSFDRVSLSCLANSERCVRPGLNLLKSLSHEIKNSNYCLLMLTYLEDKQSTSTTNQTIRYLWMKSLGDKQFKGLLKKFPQRISSYIQSYMLQKSVESCVSICKRNLEDLVSVNQISRDDETGHYDETTTGIVNLMPRLFTKGDHVPIAYNLNEIYWCMAYNKDRQDMVKDSMSILNKILKEELKYDNEIGSRLKSSQKVDYFLGKTKLEDDIKHIHNDNPESHYYSYRAVLCGIRLQDKHQENFGDNGSWLNAVKLNSILSKNLSEFATFKASVKSIVKQINRNDYAEVKKLGSRTKAIELVAELVKDENLLTSAQVAMQFSGKNNMSFEVFIQIFKKNQIGGTREIIILWIKARILFNIVEEIARLLSKSDKREILTKGRDKRLMMRGDYEEVMQSFPKGTHVKIIKDSYDMTTWAQKFIPTIFIPVFEHHFKTIPGIRDLARLIFLAHSNKTIEMPRKLVEQWMKHPDIKHDEPGMQRSKEEFLKTGKTHFVNHSNMCQGIPHYNSTVLALSCLSLRDELFRLCLKRLGVEKHIVWKTRVGSDDKGNIIGLDMRQRDSYQQYLLFGQCERASERLHSMELAVKSASGHVMYELNSAFMSNLETLSPTVKFTMAAVDCIGTTSCTNFVNESYGRVRQMRENGCSSILCSYAHSLNSRHFYNIFATGPGQENDLSRIFNTKLSMIPYDFGVYPLYDIDIQDIIGPEFYNYNIMTKHGQTDQVKLLYSPLGREETDEIFPKEDDPLMKKDHFGIHQGLVRQLKNMRSRLNINPETVTNYFVENPFIMVRGPETVEETKNIIFAKLYTKGASESLRRTSPAIYIGRLSAFRSAKAWLAPSKSESMYNVDDGSIHEIEMYTKSTYADFLKSGVNKVNSLKHLDVLKLKTVLFPQHRSFDVVNQIAGKFGPVESSAKKFSQAIRTWTVNNYNYEYTSSLKSILETSFGSSHQSSMEDVNEFRSLVKMNLGSLSEVVKDCKERGIRPLDMFFYMTKLHKNSKTSRVQAFGHGPTTNSLHMTILSLKRYNHIPGGMMILEAGVSDDVKIMENTMNTKVDNLKLLYNLSIMSDLGMINCSIQTLNPKVDGRDLITECRTIIRSIKSLSGFDNITQKTIKMLACNLLDRAELKEKLVNWKTLNYTFLRRQKKIMSPSGKITWVGDLEVLVSADTECYSIVERNGTRFIRTKGINDTGSFYRSLKTMSRTLDMEFHSFFERKYAKQGSYYLSDHSKQLHINEAENNSLNVLKVRISGTFQYKRLSDLDSFEVVKDINEKTNEIQVYLRDNTSRTATICHTNGNYYPVEIYENTTVLPTVFYLGVQLNRLLTNKSWFFNYRLPQMTSQQCVEFLRNEVDLETIIGLEDRDVKRIQDYIEVREEINEESFSVMKNATEYQESMMLEENMAGRSMEEMFREAMMAVELPGSLSKFTGQIEDWAEEVENELNHDYSSMMENLGDQDTIRMVRAFGYKKPQPRKSMFTITGLQQGAVLKSRVLNCFFNSQDLRNENIRQLPNMYLFLLPKMRDSVKSLETELSKMILQRLSEYSGKSASSIKSTLDKQTGQYVVPIAIYSNLKSGHRTNPVDLLETIIDADDDLYNNSDDDDNEISTIRQSSNYESTI